MYTKSMMHLKSCFSFNKTIAFFNVHAAVAIVSLLSELRRASVHRLVSVRRNPQ